MFLINNPFDNTPPCAIINLPWVNITDNNAARAENAAKAGADAFYSCWVADASDVPHLNDQRKMENATANGKGTGVGCG